MESRSKLSPCQCAGETRFSLGKIEKINRHNCHKITRRMVIIGKQKSHALNACMKEKKLLKTRTCLFKRDQIDGRIRANELYVFTISRENSSAQSLKYELFLIISWDLFNVRISIR